MIVKATNLINLSNQMNKWCSFFYFIYFLYLNNKHRKLIAVEIPKTFELSGRLPPFDRLCFDSHHVERGHTSSASPIKTARLSLLIIPNAWNWFVVTAHHDFENAGNKEPFEQDALNYPWSFYYTFGALVISGLPYFYTRAMRCGDLARGVSSNM